MTREEAIKHFEAVAECKYYPAKQAALMAVAALRSQPHALDRSQWEGCEQCTAKHDDWSTEGMGGHEFRIDRDSLLYYDEVYGWEGIQIKYCPFCGRPLTEAAWVELEGRLRP